MNMAMEKSLAVPLKLNRTLDSAETHPAKRSRMVSSGPNMPDGSKESSRASDFLPSLRPIAPPAVYTPTSVKVRRNFAWAIAKSINGRATEKTFFSESDTALATASPQSFCKQLRAYYEDYHLEKLLKYNITDIELESEIPRAQESIELGADIFKDEPLASTPIRKIGERLAKKYGNLPLVFHRTEESTEAATIGKLVIMNENLLKTIATEEDEIEWFLDHEIEHYLKDDLLQSSLSEQACEDQVQEKEQKGILLWQSRMQEQFADLSGPSREIRLAQAYKNVATKWVKQLGKGTPDEHPSHESRRLVALALIEFHQQHAKERERRTAEPKVKRSLLKEFEACEA
jgi:hypothetical protein